MSEDNLQIVIHPYGAYQFIGSLNVEGGPIAYGHPQRTWQQAYHSVEPLVNETRAEVEYKQKQNQIMSDKKPVSIKRLLDPDEFADAAICMCVKGKLTALYDSTSGEGDKGPYEYQNGMLDDGTGKIKVTFSSNSQPKSAKGKTVTISSMKSEQHGWQGVKVVDNSYKNKKGEQVKERILRITSTANIEYEGGESKPSDTQSSGSQSSGSSSGQTVSKYDIDLSLHPTNIMADVMAFHKAVDDNVRALYANPEAKAKTPYLYPEETIAAYVASVFIESNRTGACINFRERYAKPVPVPKKEYPPPPKDPSKWRSCVIPKGQFEGKTLEDIPDEELLRLFSHFDGAGSNTPMAECVYQAARDRDILPKKGSGEEEQPADDFPE